MGPHTKKTIRQAMMEILGKGPIDARGLSKRLRISEKEISAHMQHIEKTLRHTRMRLVIMPAECIACGYRFEARKKFTKPGRCPVCKKERIAPALYYMENM